MIRSLICSTFLSLAGFTVTSAQVDIQDSLALVAFYYATDGDQWTNNTNWLDGPVSSWHGVHLQGDRVSAINMYDNGLNGYLPQDLEQLTQLQALEIWSSSLSGGIPEIFGQMPEFYQITLEECGLTGEIPSSLGNCPNLGRINLDNNNLTGSIPSSIAACSELIMLNVGGNDLSGPFPEVIQSFPNLAQLTLSDNNFSGPVPEWIASITELYWLFLQGNNFSGPAPFLGNKPNLMQLNISSNPLTGNLEDILGFYPNLQYGNIDNTNISGVLSPSHFNPDQIVSLEVRGNHIHTLEDFSSWATKANLIRLNVSSNNLDFDDLLPNSGIPSNKYFYSPQNQLGNDTVVALLPGEEYAIYSPMQDEDIQYQWYFNQMLIEGLENYDLILPPFTPELLGDFYYTATHEALPVLTLESGITTLVEETTSVDVLNLSTLAVFPNPATDFIIIESEPSLPMMQLQLFTVDGQLLNNFTTHLSKTVVSLEAYAAGIYFIKWTSSGQSGFEKIVKR